MAGMDDEDLQKASDPALPAPELRRLAARSQAHAALIAENPNAPLDLLPRLAVLHPAAVARNPALALYLLDPGPLLQHLSLAASSSLADCPETPIFLLTLMAQSDEPSIRTIVARCTRCPIDVLRALRDDDDERVRDHAVFNLRARGDW